MKTFAFLMSAWAAAALCAQPGSAAPAVSSSLGAEEPADRPVPRADPNSQLAHQQLIQKAHKGGINVYFLGDSITRRWGASDPQYQDLLANWKTNFFGWNAADFGWGGDRTENILWRVENGELDGVNPKIIVLLAGTNNLRPHSSDGAAPDDIVRGLKAILDLCRKKAPHAVVVLTGIFPRNDDLDLMPLIEKINSHLAEMADGKAVRYLNVNSQLADPDGQLFDGMMNAKDKLHPTLKAYQIWADGLKPIFTEILGPPAKTDHAPPPTGDPSAARRAVQASSRKSHSTHLAVVVSMEGGDGGFAPSCNVRPNV